MLSLDDPRWAALQGGYRVPYDPRPVLSLLENGTKDTGAWEELWNNLHHQGDVGEASYATVPHLIGIHLHVRQLGWNLFGLVSIIDMQRHRRGNPDLLPWLAASYVQSHRDLLASALGRLKDSDDPVELQAALGFVALARGMSKLGALLTWLDDSELDEWAEDRLSWSESYSGSRSAPE